MNFLINIVYQLYIDLYIHIYIPNQAIYAAMLLGYEPAGLTVHPPPE